LYVAPEQIAGGLATPASDVYSATATFYECLTGVPPFGGSAAELMRQHRSAPVPLEGVPAALRPLVEAGMAKYAADRPADAITLAAALAAAAAGACGEGWEERGRSRLGEAAVALAALWPSATPPAAQGYAVHKVSFARRVTPLNAALVIAVIAVVAAGGTALASTRSHTVAPPPAHSPGPVHSVSLAPPPTTSGPSSLSTSPSPSPSPSSSPSPTPPPGSPAAPPTSSPPSHPKSPPPKSPPPKSPPPKSPPPSSAPPSSPPPSSAPPSSPPPSSAPPSTPPPSSPPPIQ
jgi:hypothetical protein